VGFLIWAYRPFAHFSLRWRYAMVLLVMLAIAATVPIYLALGSDFMPPLWEETIMYMPVALPGASIETMRQAIPRQDQILMSFPVVASVFAKAGRSSTPPYTRSGSCGPKCDPNRRRDCARRE
jgi:Cu(I)/Ag(I) efflux system membrane protein CusA/SilA